MQAAFKALNRRTNWPRKPSAASALFLFVIACHAQTPQASAQAPNSVSADQGPALSSPPVAIVPVDTSVAGAAQSVSGQIQTWNGRAFITTSGSVTAGPETAQVALPYRGTMRVCAASSVNLATDSAAPAGQVAGLLIALDHGAVELSFAARSDRQSSADTLLTPYFRILIGSHDASDLKVRLGDHGDTCVDNAGTEAPYVVVTSVFDGGVYRVQPGQRVMFEQGSLQSVVDQEKEPCGCPPAKAEPNEFPLAQSEGLTLTPKPVTGGTNPAGQAAQVAPLTYSGAVRAQPTAAQPAATPAAAGPANPPQTQTKTRKKGFFGKVGNFFRRVFGAEG